MKKLVVGITGASGVIYGLRLIDYLSKLKDFEIYAIITKNAINVAEHECCRSEAFLKIVRSRCSSVYREEELDSPLASSSAIYNFNSMVIAPCSLKTLASIANSYQSDLLTRTASNFLRLRKPLVLLIRETPLSTIDIINMLRASVAGSIIVPAAPAFYTIPKDVKDFVDYVVGKVLDVVGIENNLYPRWSGDLRPTQGMRLCDQFFGQECL
ncbi:MAG: UbiX family flavin prenyltransferase [Sulfolobales archaeon]|nr:UbiX family flavin prenyltransferase [Sulfolobales archaeon]MCX8185532.1 UbiX family flavin prenyltransferase [Sulfolobales archaeon]MDW7969989.1 UbiX family flavin prenyltransferase [Sulfolobales archaeon]